MEIIQKKLTENRKLELKHSIAASIVFIVVFALYQYIAEPYFHKLMMFVGHYIVPSRLGGGGDVYDQPLINIIVRPAFAIGVGGYLGWLAAHKIFPYHKVSYLIGFAITFVLIIAGAIFIVGINSNTEKVSSYTPSPPLLQNNQVAPVAPDSKAVEPPETQPMNSNAGVVAETMDAAGYTYIKVRKKDNSYIWIAVYQTRVRVGNNIEWPDTSPMRYFRSNFLKRTFEEIYFVPGIRINNAANTPSAAEHTKENRKFATSTTKKTDNVVKELTRKVPKWQSMMSGNSKSFSDCVRNSPNSSLKFSLLDIIETSNGDSAADKITRLSAYEPKAIIDLFQDCK